MELSQHTQDLLEKSGWTPIRRIDTLLYKKGYEIESYDPNEKVLGFLSSFGGLRVTHPAFRMANVLDSFHLDPVRAIEHINKERVETYEERIDESVVVIGEAYSEHFY
ncbi:SUKH-3 domain-containing protein [Paenibacillus harenae]|uniref:SUKH-3 domain-containing protein n=1 Tax=Paenibacillus harenae TaxID=306543 RepID=UPI00278FBD8E|nr:SUKH-3 domain-containing protein [Paenibacillus harenae]MDQ0062479.1 hypothetical protein [Paenibacillus harenae]